jgi:hypothetical protein
MRSYFLATPSHWNWNFVFEFSDKLYGWQFPMLFKFFIVNLEFTLFQLLLHPNGRVKMFWHHIHLKESFLKCHHTTLRFQIYDFSGLLTFTYFLRFFFVKRPDEMLQISIHHCLMSDDGLLIVAHPPHFRSSSTTHSSSSLSLSLSRSLMSIHSLWWVLHLF